jgi:hypothetical protein
MKPEIFEYTYPDMSTPLEVTIAFDYVIRWNRAIHREYETTEPYIEAVYIGNVDIMPLMRQSTLNLILEAYKESKDVPE